MRFKKAVSFITLSCFVFSSVLAQGAAAALEVRRDARQFTEIFNDFVIPSTMGRVTAAGYFGGTKVAINIQDLHCHPEVQRNISKILALLDRRYKLKKVYVEGAAGNVDTSWLGDIRDKELKKEIVETLVDQGKLTGTEHYSITARRPDLLAGLEDETLYRENLLRLDKIIAKREFFEKETARLRADLAVMKKRYFSPSNNRVDRMISEYRNGRINADKYYKLLKKYGEKLSAADAVSRIDFESYRSISAYLALMDMGKKLKYRNISRQLQEFVNVLKQKLPYSAYNFLLDKTDNFSKLDELYVYLARISKEYGLDLRGNFPQLNEFFAYLEKSREINPIELIKEEKRLVEEIRAGLSQDIGEHEVSFLADFFSYFEDYLNNRLSAEDYEYFTARVKEFRLLWGKYAAPGALAALEPDFELLDKFYAVNLERNHCFLNSIFSGSAIGKAQGPPSPASLAAADWAAASDRARQETVGALDGAEEVVVVVTGGFHTAGLERLFAERKISYLAITPNVTQDTKQSDIVYAELARQQARILSQTLAPMLVSMLVRLAEQSEGVSRTRTTGVILKDIVEAVMIRGRSSSEKEVKRQLSELLGRLNVQRIELVTRQPETTEVLIQVNGTTFVITVENGKARLAGETAGTEGSAGAQKARKSIVASLIEQGIPAAEAEIKAVLLWHAWLAARVRIGTAQWLRSVEGMDEDDGEAPAFATLSGTMREAYPWLQPVITFVDGVFTAETDSREAARERVRVRMNAKTDDRTGEPDDGEAHDPEETAVQRTIEMFRATFVQNEQAYDDKNTQTMFRLTNELVGHRNPALVAETILRHIMANARENDREFNELLATGILARMDPPVIGPVLLALYSAAASANGVPEGMRLLDTVVKILMNAPGNRLDHVQGLLHALKRDAGREYGKRVSLPRQKAESVPGLARHRDLLFEAAPGNSDILYFRDGFAQNLYRIRNADVTLAVNGLYEGAAFGRSTIKAVLDTLLVKNGRSLVPFLFAALDDPALSEGGGVFFVSLLCEAERPKVLSDTEKDRLLATTLERYGATSGEDVKKDLLNALAGLAPWIREGGARETLADFSRNEMNSIARELERINKEIDEVIAAYENRGSGGTGQNIIRRAWEIYAQRELVIARMEQHLTIVLSLAKGEPDAVPSLLQELLGHASSDTWGKDASSLILSSLTPMVANGNRTIIASLVEKFERTIPGVDFGTKWKERLEAVLSGAADRAAVAAFLKDVSAADARDPHAGYGRMGYLAILRYRDHTELLQAIVSDRGIDIHFRLHAYVTASQRNLSALIPLQRRTVLQKYADAMDAMLQALRQDAGQIKGVVTGTPGDGFTARIDDLVDIVPLQDEEAKMYIMATFLTLDEIGIGQGAGISPKGFMGTVKKIGETRIVPYFFNADSGFKLGGWFIKREVPDLFFEILAHELGHRILTDEHGFDAAGLKNGIITEFVADIYAFILATAQGRDIAKYTKGLEFEKHFEVVSQGGGQAFEEHEGARALLRIIIDASNEALSAPPDWTTLLKVTLAVIKDRGTSGMPLEGIAVEILKGYTGLDDERIEEIMKKHGYERALLQGSEPGPETGVDRQAVVQYLPQAALVNSLVALAVKLGTLIAGGTQHPAVTTGTEPDADGVTGIRSDPRSITAAPRGSLRWLRDAVAALEKDPRTPRYELRQARRLAQEMEARGYSPLEAVYHATTLDTVINKILAGRLDERTGQIVHKVHALNPRGTAGNWVSRPYIDGEEENDVSPESRRAPKDVRGNDFANRYADIPANRIRQVADFIPEYSLNEGEAPVALEMHLDFSDERVFIDEGSSHLRVGKGGLGSIAWYGINRNREENPARETGIDLTKSYVTPRLRIVARYKADVYVYDRQAGMMVKKGRVVKEVERIMPVLNELGLSVEVITYDELKEELEELAAIEEQLERAPPAPSTRPVSARDDAKSAGTNRERAGERSEGPENRNHALPRGEGEPGLAQMFGAPENRKGFLALGDMDKLGEMNKLYGKKIVDFLIDRYLRILAEEAEKTGGFAVRWGGDESIVSLPGSAEDPRQSFDRMRQRVFDELRGKYGVAKISKKLSPGMIEEIKELPGAVEINKVGSQYLLLYEIEKSADRERSTHDDLFTSLQRLNERIAGLGPGVQFALDHIYNGGWLFHPSISLGAVNVGELPEARDKGLSGEDFLVSVRQYLGRAEEEAKKTRNTLYFGIIKGSPHEEGKTILVNQRDKAGLVALRDIPQDEKTRATVAERLKYNAAVTVVRLIPSYQGEALDPTLTSSKGPDWYRFKAVNGAFGLLGGDEMIRLVYTEIKRGMEGWEAIDFSRGPPPDEFTLVLPGNISEAEIAEKVKKIRNEINRKSMLRVGFDVVAVTSSEQRNSAGAIFQSIDEIKKTLQPREEHNIVRSRTAPGDDTRLFVYHPNYQRQIDKFIEDFEDAQRLLAFAVLAQIRRGALLSVGDDGQLNPAHLTLLSTYRLVGRILKFLQLIDNENTWQYDDSRGTLRAARKITEIAVAAVVEMPATVWIAIERRFLKTSYSYHTFLDAHDTENRPLREKGLDAIIAATEAGAIIGLAIGIASAVFSLPLLGNLPYWAAIPGIAIGGTIGNIFMHSLWNFFRPDASLTLTTADNASENEKKIMNETGAREIARFYLAKDRNVFPRITAAIEEGKVVALYPGRLLPLAGKADRAGMYGAIHDYFLELAEHLDNDFRQNFGFSMKHSREAKGRDLWYFISEMLKNAFVHGNALEVDKPIYLFVDLRARRLRMINTVDAGAKISEAQRIDAERAGLAGQGKGIIFMKGDMQQLTPWERSRLQMVIDREREDSIRVEYRDNGTRAEKDLFVAEVSYQETLPGSDAGKGENAGEPYRYRLDLSRASDPRLAVTLKNRNAGKERTVEAVYAGKIGNSYVFEHPSVYDPDVTWVVYIEDKGDRDYHRRFNLLAGNYGINTRGWKVPENPRIPVGPKLIDLDGTDGHRYAVASFIKGESLEKRAQRGRSMTESYDDFNMVLDLLARLMDQGILVKDFTPRNIKIGYLPSGKEMRAYVLDASGVEPLSAARESGKIRAYLNSSEFLKSLKEWEDVEPSVSLKIGNWLEERLESAEARERRKALAINAPEAGSATLVTAGISLALAAIVASLTGHSADFNALRSAVPFIAPAVFMSGLIFFGQVLTVVRWISNVPGLRGGPTEPGDTEKRSFLDLLKRGPENDISGYFFKPDNGVILVRPDLYDKLTALPLLIQKLLLYGSGIAGHEIAHLQGHGERFSYWGTQIIPTVTGSLLLGGVAAALGVPAVLAFSAGILGAGIAAGLRSWLLFRSFSRSGDVFSVRQETGYGDSRVAGALGERYGARGTFAINLSEYRGNEKALEEAVRQGKLVIMRPGNFDIGLHDVFGGNSLLWLLDDVGITPHLDRIFRRLSSRRIRYETYRRLNILLSRHEVAYNLSTLLPLESGGSLLYLQEMLRNALVHGNQLDPAAPIYLYMDPVQKRMVVANIVSDTRASRADLALARRARLFGQNLGEKSMTGDAMAYRRYEETIGGRRVTIAEAVEKGPREAAIPVEAYRELSPRQDKGASRTVRLRGSTTAVLRAINPLPLIQDIIRRIHNIGAYQEFRKQWPELVGKAIYNVYLDRGSGRDIDPAARGARGNVVDVTLLRDAAEKDTIRFVYNIAITVPGLYEGIAAVRSAYDARDGKLTLFIEIPSGIPKDKEPLFLANASLSLMRELAGSFRARWRVNGRRSFGVLNGVLIGYVPAAVIVDGGIFGNMQESRLRYDQAFEETAYIVDGKGTRPGDNASSRASRVIENVAKESAESLVNMSGNAMKDKHAEGVARINELAVVVDVDVFGSLNPKEIRVLAAQMKKEGVPRLLLDLNGKSITDAAEKNIRQVRSEKIDVVGSYKAGDDLAEARQRAGELLSRGIGELDLDVSGTRWRSEAKLGEWVNAIARQSPDTLISVRLTDRVLREGSERVERAEINGVPREELSEAASAGLENNVAVTGKRKYRELFLEKLGHDIHELLSQQRYLFVRLLHERILEAISDMPVTPERLYDSMLRYALKDVPGIEVWTAIKMIVDKEGYAEARRYFTGEEKDVRNAVSALYRSGPEIPDRLAGELKGLLAAGTPARSGQAGARLEELLRRYRAAKDTAAKDLEEEAVAMLFAFLKGAGEGALVKDRTKKDELETGRPGYASLEDQKKLGQMLLIADLLPAKTGEPYSRKVKQIVETLTARAEEMEGEQFGRLRDRSFGELYTMADRNEPGALRALVEMLELFADRRAQTRIEKMDKLYRSTEIRAILGAA